MLAFLSVGENPRFFVQGNPPQDMKTLGLEFRLQAAWRLGCIIRRPAGPCLQQPSDAQSQRRAPVATALWPVNVECALTEMRTARRAMRGLTYSQQLARATLERVGVGITKLQFNTLAVALNRLAADAEFFRDLSRSVSGGNQRKYCQLAVAKRAKPLRQISVTSKPLHRQRGYGRAGIDFTCDHGLDRTHQFFGGTVFHPITGRASQTRAAKTVEIYGWLIFAEGIFILLFPQAVAELLRFGPLGYEGLTFFRLAGLLIAGIGMLYFVSGRMNAEGFVFATLLVRPVVPPIMAVLWYSGKLPGSLALLFAIQELASFLWTLLTWRADMRRE
jgi:hypothetical protein